MVDVKFGENTVTLEVSENGINETFDFEVGKEALTDGKAYVLRKSAIHRLVTALGIIVGEPKNFYVGKNIAISRAATFGKRTEYALGDASEASLENDIARKYPFIMADNRAYQRAVIQVLGLAGRFYGEDELKISNSNGKKEQSENAPNQNIDESTPPVTSKPVTSNYQASPTGQGNTASYFTVSAEHTAKYSWLTQQTADELANINPDTYIMEQGRHKDKKWSATQTFELAPETAEWYAAKGYGPNEKFNEAVSACRKAIINSLR